MKFLGRENIIKKIQSALGLVADGIDGPKTWNTIAEKLGVVLEEEQHTNNTITQSALDLIINYEIGNKIYYNSYLKKPTYPGGASGVTIGIGYDLGYNTGEQFEKDWKHLLDNNTFNRLVKCLGFKGASAKSKINSLSDISIPWSTALDVFVNSTLPRFITLTQRTFPGYGKLCPDAFGALVSIVFNRGSSLSGSSRSEMLDIHKALRGEIKVDDIHDYIASKVISMKRLWVGKKLDGLLRRRDAEAELIKSCVKNK
jgi:hypothetical protein